jgi:hypothetical protein
VEKPNFLFLPLDRTFVRHLVVVASEATKCIN